MLGVHADAILDQRVDLTEVWGRPRADELLDRVARAADTGGVANATDAGGVANATDTSGFWKPTETCGVAKLLEAAVRRRLAAAAPDLLVDALVARLSARRESAPRVLRTLAAELGATERSLHRRCTAAVGYGPKTLDRVLRFRRARRLAGRSGAVDLADLAVAAGYADQAHMTRECRRLSGLTPSEMFKTRRR
jgi:AraC-like DNA-binding protein